MFFYIIISSLITFIFSIPRFPSYNFTIGDKGTTFESMLRNKMEVQVYIGTPEQCLTLEVETGKSLTWVIDSTTPKVEMEPRFHSELSSTFKRQAVDHPQEFKFHQVETGHQFTDLIRVGQTTINATMIIPKTFKVVDRRGVIGLHKELPGTFIQSLITQYQGKNKISHYEFSIEYNSPTTGFIEFGQAYKYNNDAQLIFFSFYEKETIFAAYVITADFILFNENAEKISGCTISIDINFGFLLAPFRKKIAIEETYSLKDPMCHEQESWFDKGQQTFRIYYYYLCENAFIEKHLPTYGTFKAQFNHKANDIITLEKEELFQDFNSTHKVFVIAIKKGETRNHDWIFGAPFLKKYKIVYNTFKSTIGFMTYDPLLMKRSWSNMWLIHLVISLFALLTFVIIIRRFIIKTTIKKKQENLINKIIDFEYYKQVEREIVTSAA